MERHPPGGHAGAHIALWVLQVLMAAAFVMAAVTKFTGYPDTVETFQQIGLGDWFMYLIAALELAGAVGLLIPRLSGLAGLALVGLLIGAVVTQLLVAEPVTAVIPGVYLIVVGAIAWGRRARTAELIGFRPALDSGWTFGVFAPKTGAGSHVCPESSVRPAG